MTFAVFGRKPCLVGLLGVALCSCSGDDGSDAGQGGSGGSAISQGGTTPNGGATPSGGAISQGGQLSAGTFSAGGGSGSPGGGSGGASADAAVEACFAYLDGYCEMNARCFDGGEAYVRFCIATFGPFCPDMLFSDGSTRTLDGTVACAEDWRSFSCDAFERGESPPCATPGTRAPGEACTFTFQCDALGCTDFGDACGVCRTPAGMGASCAEPTVICEPGLECDPETSLCSPWTPTIEPDPPALGDECDPAVGCEREVGNCKLDEASGGYTCQRWSTLGESCSVSIACEPGAYCGESRTCVAEPGLGEPCGMDAFSPGPTWCYEDLFCDTTATPPICVSPAGPGAVCTVSCVAGFACECDDEACAARHCRRARFPGESCDGPGDVCLENVSTCQNGTCVATGSQGLFETLCGQ